MRADALKPWCSIKAMLQATYRTVYKDSGVKSESFNGIVIIYFAIDKRPL